MGLLTAPWPASRVTAVIAVPGDRADSVIDEARRAAARAFDRIIVKEDGDPRGRARHEISRRLCGAIQRERPGRECQVVLDEREALTRALRDAEPRELVVVFYDDYEAVMEVLRVHGAAAASVPAAATDDRRDSSERGDAQAEAYAEADRAAR
jgi:cyanophycin synthetase